MRIVGPVCKYVGIQLVDSLPTKHRREFGRFVCKINTVRDALCQPDRNLPSDSIRSMTCHVFLIYAEPDMF
jgi:hypothetical protein